MAGEEANDPLRPVQWKNMGYEANSTAPAASNNPENGKPIVKKRVTKKFREIPEYYFLPRKTIPAAIGFYGSFIVAGVGCAMLLEKWMNKKIKEDGGNGVIWEFK